MAVVIAWNDGRDRRRVLGGARALHFHGTSNLVCLAGTPARARLEGGEIIATAPTTLNVARVRHVINWGTDTLVPIYVASRTLKLPPNATPAAGATKRRRAGHRRSDHTAGMVCPGTWIKAKVCKSRSGRCPGPPTRAPFVLKAVR